MTRREREERERREGWLSYASSRCSQNRAEEEEEGGRRGGGYSQRYSRKSNEREPNEAILKGDIVGSLGRRTNSITSSCDRTKRESAERRADGDEREREETGQDEALCVHTREGKVHDALSVCTDTRRRTLLQERIGFSPDRSITISLDYAFNIVAAGSPGFRVPGTLQTTKPASSDR